VLGFHFRLFSFNVTDDYEIQVLVDYGYVWDSSASIPPTPVPIWPYTLDYAIPHECRSGTCPTRSFPGLLALNLKYWFINFIPPVESFTDFRK